MLLAGNISSIFAQSEVSKSIKFTSSDGYTYEASIKGIAYSTSMEWIVNMNCRAKDAIEISLSGEEFNKSEYKINSDEYQILYKAHCIETQESSFMSIKYQDDQTGKIYHETLTLTMPDLSFTTLPAKATSNTMAMLAATTNIEDEDAQTGFEWQREDDSQSSTQTFGPVVDSEIVASLDNLSPNTYYKYRPYYTSATGNTYYGEWSLFKTANTYTYFDPIVKTYSAQQIMGNSARMCGYVVNGSDEITKQGFEYWLVGSSNGNTTSNHKTVEVSGNSMNYDLTGLQLNTTYAFKAFATTSKGTVYGEEQTFSTTDQTGVYDIESKKEIVPIAYYDIMGHKLDNPIKGITIVKYSDGTSQKVISNR